MYVFLQIINLCVTIHYNNNILDSNDDEVVSETEEDYPANTMVLPPVSIHVHMHCT